MLTTDSGGLDVMTVHCEQADHESSGGDLRRHLEEEIPSRCEVRVAAEVLALGTLPKTEVKAQRVKNRRTKA